MRDVYPRTFYVETQRDDGSWRRFSLNIEGEEEAQGHLEFVKRMATEEDSFAKRLDPNRIRLREMTQEEIDLYNIRQVLRKVTADERDAMILDFVHTVGLGEFVRRLESWREKIKVLVGGQEHDAADSD
jgi:hypothetical protein